MKIIFDIETDGFLQNLTTIHCFVTYEIDSKRTRRFRDNIIEGIGYLEQAQVLIGHNIKKFDIPALKKIYSFSPKGEIFDTLEYARRLWPKIIENDNEENIIPIELRGRHSLKAWGYRLTNQKGDYEGPWDLYSEAMMDYCEQDVKVTYELWRKIKSRL